jgi:outer membrane lipoprotein-sorting protein
MLKWNRMAVAGAMVATLLTAASAEPTLDSVEKEIAERLKTLKSYTADMKMEASTTIGPIPVKTKGKGTVEKLLVDEVWRFRMNLVNTMTSDSLPGAMGGMQTTVLTVFDGEMNYAEAEIMGMKQVMKKAPEPTDVVRKGDAPFAKLRAQGEIKLLPEEKVGEAPCYVIQVIASDEARAAKPELPRRIMMYFAKDSGIPVRSHMFGEADKSIGSMELSNIKLNPELDPEKFTYTPPDGVTVKDITGMKPSALGL